MALVVPGVCRFTIVGNQDGFAVDNVIDIHLEDAVGSSTREQNIIDQAHILVTAWRVNIMDVMVNDYQATEVRWVDLDSETGITGSTSTGSGAGFPANGANTDAPAPAGVAWLCKKTIASHARGIRSGRLYVGGVPSNILDPADGSLLSGSILTAFQTKANNFLAAVNQNAGIVEPIYNSQMVVVHQTAGGTPSSSDVGSLVVQSRIAFQRRRSGR